MTQTAPIAELSVDSLFATLANADRRAILDFLTEDNPSVGLVELVDHLWDNRAPDESGAIFDFDRIEIDLVHRHLPKLAQAGLVEYDRSDRTVTRTSLTGWSEPHLALVRAQRR